MKSTLEKTLIGPEVAVLQAIKTCMFRVYALFELVGCCASVCLHLFSGHHPSVRCYYIRVALGVIANCHHFAKCAAMCWTACVHKYLDALHAVL